MTPEQQAGRVSQLREDGSEQVQLPIPTWNAFGYLPQAMFAGDVWAKTSSALCQFRGIRAAGKKSETRDTAKWGKHEKRGLVRQDKTRRDKPGIHWKNQHWDVL